MSYIIFLTFRLLCLDAIVEEGDLDKDWRLSEAEFLRIMDSTYEMSNKCKLNIFITRQESSMIHLTSPTTCLEKDLFCSPSLDLVCTDRRTDICTYVRVWI